MAVEGFNDRYKVTEPVGIERFNAYEVLDSRGNPTIRVSMVAGGLCFHATVPSGASTGEKEALELRDGDKSRFGGKGVLKAISNAKEAVRRLEGLNIFNQREIDELLINFDGTGNFERIGANAALGISMLVARAAASMINEPLYRYINNPLGEDPRDIKDVKVLPTPMLNIINGGAHADNGVDIQEFMIMPLKFPTFREALRASAEIYAILKDLLRSKGLSTALGDEGGFAPKLKSNAEALDLIQESIKRANYEGKVGLALDVAASEFFNKSSGKYKFENKELSADELISYYENLVKNYPLVSIEDPLDENDLSGWTNLTKELTNRVQLVGDDLFVTNEKILRMGINSNIANAILIKLNQIGTLTQTLDTINLAHRYAYKCIISHRSGESVDTFISDLAVATNAGQIKAGSLARGERVEKYNRLLEIEQDDNLTRYKQREVKKPE